MQDEEIAETKFMHMEHLSSLPTENGRHRTTTKKKRKSSQLWRDAYVDFTNSTTLHGLRYTTLERPLLCRIIWMLIVCGAFGGFLYYIIDRVNAYLRFDTNVNVIVNYIDDMAFPAVTICNQNGFKLTNAVYGGWYNEVISMSNHSQGPKDQCLGDEFQCNNGKCIQSSRVCDMFPDCSDDSDELDCDICKRVRISTTSRPTSSISGLYLFGEGLPTRYEAESLVYLSIDVTSKQYSLVLANVNGPWHQWHIVTYDKGNIRNTVARSENVNKHGQFGKMLRWTIHYVNGSHEIINDVKVICDVRAVEQPHVTKLALSKNKKFRDLRHFYELGAHGKKDFFLLDKCKWMGEPIAEEDLAVSFTDMGLCYTFKPRSGVKKSGPGNGLSLLVNVEQYEYTSEPLGGAGVKMLLHDHDAPPIMQGQSLSISPGLFSLVSLERAQVVGLGPPWGNCSEKELEYYSKYGVSTCMLDCQNDILRKGCECVDVYLASGDMGETFQKERGCSCKQPCIQDIFVPTLSFSSLSFDKDKLSRADILKMQELESTLSEAREIIYRIQENHYRNTMRVFDGIFQHAWRGYYAIQAVEEILLEELIEINGLTSQVKSDCLKFQRHLNSGIKMMRRAMRSEILMFENHLLYNVSSGLQRLSIEVSRVTGIWKEMKRKVEENNIKNMLLFTETPYDTTTYDTTTYAPFTADYNTTNTTNAPIQAMVLSCACPIPELVNLTEEDRNSLSVHLKPVYDQVKMDVENTAFALLKSVVDAALRLKESDSFYFVWQKEKIEWLIPYLRVVCDWCLTEMEDSLFNILGDRIIQGILAERSTSNLFDECEVRDAVPSDNIAAYLCFLYKSLVTLDESGFMRNATFIDLYDDDESEALHLAEHIHKLSAGIPDVLAAFRHSTTVDLDVAVDMAQDLLDKVTPSCDNGLQKMYEDYANLHSLTEWTLDKIKLYLIKYMNRYAGDLAAYQKGPQTRSLRELCRISSFDADVIYMQGKYISIESLLQDRMIALKRTGHQINRLYFWFMAQIPTHVLAVESSFWNNFRLTSPGFSNPGPDHLTGEHTPLDPGVALLSPVVDAFWNNTQYKITRLQGDALDEIRQLLDNMRASGKFFKDFADGNNVDESFYKKNFVQLDVFYKELTQRAVVTQKAFEYPALLGEIGGLMGLILGASAITLIEFFDMIFYGIYVQCTQRKNPVISNKY